jgi:hypothetical protein
MNAQTFADKLARAKADKSAFDTMRKSVESAPDNGNGTAWRDELLAVPELNPVTVKAWDAYDRGACGTAYIRHKMNDLETEVIKLRDIIRRASTKFCEDGDDSAIAAAMFAILGEGRTIQ